MSELGPPPRLRDVADDPALRDELAAAATLGVEYDVEAGAARFEATIAAAPLPPPTPDPATESVAASSASAGKISVWWWVGIVAVSAGGLVWALSSDPPPPPPAAEPAVTAQRTDPVPPETTAPPIPSSPPTDPDPTPTTDVPASTDAEATAPAADPDRAPAPTSKRPRPRPTPPGDDVDTLHAEMQATHAARQALRTDPAKALSLARQADTDFPKGKFAQDRDGIEILALFALGRTEDAETKARRFLAAHPKATYADQIRQALGD